MPESAAGGGSTASASRPGTSMTNKTAQTCQTTNSRLTWMTEGGTHRKGKGQLLWTGPCGKRHHDVKTFSPDDLREVGIGDVSAEKSSELTYLYRGAEGTQFPTTKAAVPGAIGWGLPQKGDPRSWPVHLNIKSEKDFKQAQREAEGIWQRR